jgi:hypothetical protein
MEPSNLFNIPHYVKAASPEGLRLSMLQNNMKLKAECKYFDISFDGNNWVAWFYKTANESVTVLKKKRD